MINRLGFLALAFSIASSAAQADFQSRSFKKQIDGLPVQVHVVRATKPADNSRWIALLPTAFPHPGMSVPEMVSAASARLGTNANFYKEDEPGRQEPIGLVVHEGQLLSFANRYYPSIGLLEGKLEWDKVTVTAEVLVESGAIVHRRKICRLNAPAVAGCAAIWSMPPQKELSSLIAIKESGFGPKLGRHEYQPFEQAPESSGYRVQWPGKLPGIVTKVTIDVRLSGERLGERWNKATEAVSGSHFLSADRVYPNATREWALARQPRTLVGIDRAGNGYIAVFDGRTEASRGISVKGAWEFARKNLNARWAINLDGGGSSAIVFDGRLLNKPSDGYPRPVAVGFGAR